MYQCHAHEVSASCHPEVWRHQAKTNLVVLLSGATNRYMFGSQRRDDSYHRSRGKQAYVTALCPQPQLMKPNMFPRIYEIDNMRKPGRLNSELHKNLTSLHL